MGLAFFSSKLYYYRLYSLVVEYLTSRTVSFGLLKDPTESGQRLLSTATILSLSTAGLTGAESGGAAVVQFLQARVGTES